MSINKLTDQQRIELIERTREQSKIETLTDDFKSNLSDLIIVATQEFYLRKSFDAKNIVREQLFNNITKSWEGKTEKQMIDCLVIVNEKMQAFGIQINKIEKMASDSANEDLLKEISKFKDMMFDKPETKEETQ